MIRLLFTIATVWSARAIDLPRGLGLCEGNLVYTGSYDLEEPGAQITRLLGLRPLHSSLLVEFFVGHPLLAHLHLAELFAGSVAVSEGYTLREHTLMVLDLLRDQERHYDLPLRLHGALVFATVFHDVGKPAVQKMFCEEHGRAPETREELKACSARQYSATGPLLRSIGEALRLPREFLETALGLTDGDVIGQVIRDKFTPLEGAGRLRETAWRTGWWPNQFFAAKALLYVSDAGSYPGLRYGRGLSENPKPPVLVEEANGRLVPVSPDFESLQFLMK